MIQNLKTIALQEIEKVMEPEKARRLISDLFDDEEGKASYLIPGSMMKLPQLAFDLCDYMADYINWEPSEPVTYSILKGFFDTLPKEHYMYIEVNEIKELWFLYRDKTNILNNQEFIIYALDQKGAQQ